LHWKKFGKSIPPICSEPILGDFMKAMLIMGAMILTSIAANAGSNNSYQCTTDTGKKVEIEYSGNSRRMDKVIIDGATYTDASEVIVTSKGVAMVFVDFRDNETLEMVIQGGSSYYKLGSGRERPMTCLNVTNRGTSPRNDGI
jgi:hypothetical protein